MDSPLLPRQQNPSIIFDEKNEMMKWIVSLCDEAVVCRFDDIYGVGTLPKDAKRY